MRVLVFLLLLVLLFVDALTTTAPREWLGEESVVLVCGAASYLGSELSLALHRIYSPKRLILVDGLLSSDNVEGLSRLEFQRQRLFRVLQEIATSESGNALFYRVDLRPEVPEFIDSSVVPVLEYIVKQHDDITHIVYLPEEKSLNEERNGNPKAILMHALLDQLVNWKNVTGSSNVPNFIYGSSYKVYSGDGTGSPRLYRGRDDRPIKEAPTSLDGGAYLLDEVLAQTYFEKFRVPSVGLRLFSVYGPFDTPLSLTSQIADHAVAAISDPTSVLSLPEEDFGARYDYVFIDDAVDAIMIAMQLRPQSGPLAINIGSGKPTETIDLIKLVQSFVPDAKIRNVKTKQKKKKQVDVVANTDKAKVILGWEPTVSIREGILKTLGWHFDRLYPKGKTPFPTKAGDKPSDQKEPWEKVAAAGRSACDIRDLECLRGVAIYPCASECAHATQCIPSFWDKAASESLRLSSGCSEVWYTVALNPDLVALPSVQVRASSKPLSNSTKCNFAFVDARSPLVRRLQKNYDRDATLHYDFWTLIPVTIDSSTDMHIATLVMLPKFSPSSFFATTVDMALYTDPHIIFDNLPRLLAEARLQPYNPENPSATGLLVGKRGSEGTTKSMKSLEKNSVQQTGAYRMMHMKALEYLNANQDGFKHEIDTSFLVHRVRDKDVASFRCDVFGEIWSWKVTTDNEALSFIGGLHDMWSQIILSQNGDHKTPGNIEPWWYADNVQTIHDIPQQHGRRLEETTTVQKAPLQYHHLLQKHIAGDEEEHFEKVHHFDENGFAIHQRKREQLPANPSDSLDNAPETGENEGERDHEDVGNENETELKSQKWLAMLSSGRTKFFVRLVYADDIGVVDLKSLPDQGPSLIL